jgi:hypothetical protein
MTAIRMSGASALDADYRGSVPAALNDRADRGTIGHFVRQGVSIARPFRKTEVSDAEFADLSLYLGLNRRN